MPISADYNRTVAIMSILGGGLLGVASSINLWANGRITGSPLPNFPRIH